MLEKRSVKCICARLRRDLPKSAGYLAVFGVVIAGREFHRLHGVLRRHDDGQPLDRLGVFNSIQQVTICIGCCSVDVDVEVEVGARILWVKIQLAARHRNSRSQKRQSSDVVAECRQAADF